MQILDEAIVAAEFLIDYSTKSMKLNSEKRGGDKGGQKISDRGGLKILVKVLNRINHPEPSESL